jgi:hypothetical protein
VSLAPVRDPFHVDDDPKLPGVRLALDAAAMEPKLSRILERAQEAAFLCGIGVVRHKPGRRCLIQYDFERSGAEGGRFSVLGKVRARGLDERTPKLMRALRRAGFCEQAADGVCVPEPLGVVEECRMWLQRKVAGSSAWPPLAGPGGTELAARVAEALVKLHEAGVPTRRRHGMQDELRILRERLEGLAAREPAWAGRLERVVEACERLGGRLEASEPRGIHRDFYHDQVLVDGDRLHLIDLDLYCAGDASLDAGNFIAHLTEQALRQQGGPAALADRERSLEERFLQLAGGWRRAAVRTYTTLSLARHIQISTLFEDRRPFTPLLLELCEERLDLPRGLRSA